MPHYTFLAAAVTCQLTKKGISPNSLGNGHKLDRGTSSTIPKSTKRSFTLQNIEKN